MKHFYLLLFLFISSIACSQEIVKPFAPTNDSIPNFADFVERNDLYTMDADTVTLNVAYIKKPYFRSDDMWGVVNSDLYITYDNITYIDGKEKSKTLYYLRDYKNQKPTQFVLCSENEMKSILKEAQDDGEPFYFLRPEKFVITKSTDGTKTVTLKRVSVPKYFRIQID